jgi:hypothetical protein
MLEDFGAGSFTGTVSAMNTRSKFAICIFLATVLWARSESTPQPKGAQLSVSEIAVSFTNYQQMTKNVAFVKPELAMLCRGASKADVDAARIKFGLHANTGILIFMNKEAAQAFSTNASVFPVGAVVVKQKKIYGYFDKDGNPVREADTGVGGMIKRSVGYDPEHGDWEYFYFEAAKKVESGRIPSCVQCHESAKSKDYVFGTWSNTGR